MNDDIFNTSGPTQTKAVLLASAGMIVVIGSALGFEHLGGYAPCALCLEQRNPYYWGIPIMLVGCLSALMKWPACLTRGALMIGFLCLVATALMGAYHAGVEWHYWPGPETCTAGISGGTVDGGSLFDDLATSKPPSCVDAAGRFLGISFAGWNVIAASVLAVIAFRGAFGPTGNSNEI